jgi:ArsR family transcriptional regulator
MRELLTFTHALADETRWRLLRLLFDEPLCVCELADILGLPQSSASSHLQILRQAGLLESERRGKWIYYRVARARRPLLRQLSETFQAGPSNSRVLASDAARARKRLAARAASCCPLPKKTISRKPSQPAPRP